MLGSYEVSFAEYFFAGRDFAAKNLCTTSAKTFGAYAMILTAPAIEDIVAHFARWADVENDSQEAIRESMLEADSIGITSESLYKALLQDFGYVAYPPLVLVDTEAKSLIQTPQQAQKHERYFDQFRVLSWFQ